MIGKVLRGDRVGGLLRYLYGPGKANVHTDPHLVAGFADPQEMEPTQRPDGRRDFRRLVGLLNQPLAALGPHGHDKPVWHCVLRAAPEDPLLTDAQWADIAAEVMHHAGLARRGDDEAVRWVAVRHANDHVHLVATLARQDGTAPRVWNDYYRVREACQCVERRYGLRITAPGDRTAARRPTRAETEKTHRLGQPEPARTVLRRTVQLAAAGARSPSDFFHRLTAAGLQLRLRHSQHNPGQITGYAVALPDHTTATGEPIWYGGGKLAADLTLPKLAHRWTTPQPAADGKYSPAGPEGAALSPAGAERGMPSAVGTERGKPSAERLSAPVARAFLRSAARQAAARTHTLQDYFAALTADQILIRPRYSQHTPGQITGYTLAHPAHTDAAGNPIHYAAAKLAPDLALSWLHQAWARRRRNPSPYAAPGPALTHHEREAIYAHAARSANRAALHLQRRGATATSDGHDIAWASADLLNLTANLLGTRQLRHAAGAYDRAARAPYGRTPRPSPSGHTLRTAARLLAIAAPEPASISLAATTLLASLAALTAAVAELRHAQHQTAQFHAARATVRHLSTVQAQAAGQSWRSSFATIEPGDGLANEEFLGLPDPLKRMTNPEPATARAATPLRHRRRGQQP